MAELPPNWSDFIATVEGRQSPTSAVLCDGLPVLSTVAIPRGAEPNLRLLADLLRSDTPLPPEVRAWMASLFDPEGAGEFQVKKLHRRATGAKPASFDKYEKAVTYFLERERESIKLTAIYEDVKDKLGVEMDTLRKFVKAKKIAMAEATVAEDEADNVYDADFRAMTDEERIAHREIIARSQAQRRDFDAGKRREAFSVVVPDAEAGKCE